MTTHDAFIRQHLSWKYKNRVFTQEALLSSLAAFPSLYPKNDTFVFSDSTKKTLFCLDGTIPVLFKGASYNIPICIWLLEDFPYSQPMCYVKPTQNMLIKPSKHVDMEGKVYLPYLHDWKHPDSDLIGLIHVMMIVFGENCPVYSHRSSSTQDPVQPVIFKQVVTSKEQLGEIITGSPSRNTKVIVNQLTVKLQESTRSLNRFITSLNLAWAFQELREKNCVPKSLLDKCCQVQEAGGVEAMDLLLSELEKGAEQNSQILNETEAELNAEALAYNQMKEIHKEKWTRNCMASDHLTSGYREVGSKYRAILEDARQADAIVQQKTNSCRSSIMILSKTKLSPEKDFPAFNLKDAVAMEETIRNEREIINRKLRNIASDVKDHVSDPNSDDLSIIQQVEEIIQKQNKLQHAVRMIHVELSSNPAYSRRITTEKRKKKLDLLHSALDTYISLTVNLKEGVKFYNDLALLLTNEQSKVTDFCSARKSEREELVRMLTAESSKNDASTTINAHQTYQEKTTEHFTENETLNVSGYLQMATKTSEGAAVTKHEGDIGELERKLQNSKVQSGMERRSPSQDFQVKGDKVKGGGNSSNTEENAGAKGPVLSADNYSTQLKTVEERIRQREASWENERREMERRIKELDGEVKTLQEQLKQVNNESQGTKQRFESKIVDLETELHQTKQEKTSFQAEVERLQKELKDSREQQQRENEPEKRKSRVDAEDASQLSTKQTKNINLADFGKFQYHLSLYLTQDVIRDLTLVLAFSPTESEQAEQDKIKFIRLMREKGLISQADITPLTSALVTIGRHGVCDTVMKLLQKDPSEE